MRHLVLLVFLIILPAISSAQEKKKINIKFSGFVKADIFWDSRQTVDARDGHFFLYPKNESLDSNGKDINAVSKFNILAIQSRMKGTLTGPDVLGAKTTGIIEGAFFGNIGSDINGFRLRHAFIKLNWENSALLVGQFWHPMFVTSCFPGTISFNTGTPFQPFSRNPQIRFSQSIDNFKIIATLLEQVDFKSTGPDGTNTKYIINNGFPETDLRLDYQSGSFAIGAGINYKSLLPRLQIDMDNNGTTNTYKTDEKVSGLSYYSYLKYKNEHFTAKAYGTIAELTYSMTMLGGYAERERMASQTGGDYYSYTPIRIASSWIDLHTNGKKWQAGLFAGYTKNNGTKETNNNTYYARGANIDKVFRVAPRLIYKHENFKFAPEIEYTLTAYGSSGSDGKINNAKNIDNLRLLIGVFYNF